MLVLGVVGLLIGLAPPEAAAADAPGRIPAARMAAELAAAHFPDALIASAATTAAEDRALLRALAAYERRREVDDVTSLVTFLAAHPHSGWRAALLTNLGVSYLHYGYLSRALDAWETAWRDGKSARGPYVRALVDQAVGKLVLLHAELGHPQRVAALFDEIADRPVSGPATEWVQLAREIQWVMQNDPKHLYLCGPQALKSLMLAEHASAAQVRFIWKYRAGPKGVSLGELARLAGKEKAAYVPVFRSPGQSVPVPSIVHWKLGHYAAILGEANGRYRVKDPVLGIQDRWVTPAALEAEASGYFLAPEGKVAAAGWRRVDGDEGGRVWGAGPTGGPPPEDPGPPADPPPDDCGGMCGYNISELAVGVTLADTPVGYMPPLGPSARVQLTYNQREASQPAVFSFFNVSPKWTFNFLTYIQDDPNAPGSNVMRVRRHGGAWLYTGYDSATRAFAPEEKDASVLVLSSPSPVTYRRRLNDGTVEIYAQSDGATGFPRRVFLSQIIDPQGNALTLNYGSASGQTRLDSLTDATGRQTSFVYGVAGAPLLVTQITDPFGRSATLAYDASGRLSSITDVLGLTSSFSYDASSLIDTMTTPYGTTQFAYGGTGNTRFVQVTDPLGNNEREETLQPSPGPFNDPPNLVPQGIINPFNQYLNYRNSFHWDQHAYVAAACTPTGGCDYGKARMTHFTHDAVNENITWGAVESRKYPLENRIWYNYPNQTCGIGTACSGSYDGPTRIGRVLDDGSTQLTQYAYNPFGNMTLMVDPAGRTTSFTYAPNMIDMVQVLQAAPEGDQQLAGYTYNGQHRPLSYTNAAGQATRYTYNAAGQLTQTALPLGRVWQFGYDALGRLTQIVNPNGAIAASYGYDAFDRVATATDSEGYTLAYAYDAFNRITGITYPDGTTRQYAYANLDLVSVTDRQGRTTIYGYDADRRLVSMTDPLGNTTQYAYWENGALKSLTDPKGNTTQWAIDVENRITQKKYVDNTIVNYAYDSASRIRSITDALGQTKQYSYAVDNRLSVIDYLNAVNPTSFVYFEYDKVFPRLAAMYDDATGWTQFSYGPTGSPGALQLHEEAYPVLGGTVGYRYDAADRLVGRSVGSASQEGFAYDALDRVVQRTNPLGQFTLSYLGQTRQQTGLHLGGTAVDLTRGYLPNTGDRRLAAIDNAGVRQYGYTTTPESLITGITEQGSNPLSWNFGYDGANRLIGAASSTGAQYDLTLDPAGNIGALQFAAGTVAAAYNALNELTQVTVTTPDGSSSISYTYDANGNLVSDGPRSYAWDAENRLVGIAYAGQPGRATRFVYDALGRRAAIIEQAADRAPVITAYLWCGLTICQARNYPEDTLARLYYDEGEVIPATGTRLYYGRDQLGSVRDFAVVTAEGTTIQAYDFDPLGNPLRAPAGGPTPDFRFAGMFYHAGSGLYLTQYRAYDPRIARWLSRDPIEEYVSPNLYTYAGGDPIGFIDPSGLKNVYCNSGNPRGNFQPGDTLMLPNGWSAYSNPTSESTDVYPPGMSPGNGQPAYSIPYGQSYNIPGTDVTVTNGHAGTATYPSYSTSPPAPSTESPTTTIRWAPSSQNAFPPGTVGPAPITNPNPTGMGPGISGLPPMAGCCGK